MTYEKAKKVRRARTWYTLFVFSALFFVPQVSFAEPDPVAAVQCDATHNRAAIRFGTSDTDTGPDGSPVNDGIYGDIPAELSASWTGVPHQLDGTCRFANGDVFKVSQYGPGPLFNWRYGANFSLTINGRVAYYHYVFYWSSSPVGLHGGQPGYAAPVKAVFYDHGKLTECDTAAGSSGPECHDVSKRLQAGYQLTDKYEKAALAFTQARLQVVNALSPFCKSLDFSQSASKGWGKTWKLILSSDKSTPVHYDYFGVSELDVDISNAGKIERVFQLIEERDDTPSNEVLVWFPKNPAMAEDFFNNVSHQLVGASFFGSKIEVGFTREQEAAMVEVGNQVSADELLNNEDVPAGDNEIFVLQGKTYIYSQSGRLPLGVSTRILEVMPDESVKTVCELPMAPDTTF